MVSLISKSPQRRKTEKYVNYGMIVLKTELNRSKETEEQLHKAIKGSNELFFKQIRRCPCGANRRSKGKKCSWNT